jgi:DNA helicase II / ATP-dependent DNA helicase PcrA
MVPSIYQEAIYNYIKTGDGNLVVHAGAGSGKTTTAVEALKYIPSGKKTIFLAFNKAIAVELQKRVPSSVVVKTLHALGWGAVMKNYSASLEGDKVYFAIQELAKGWTDLPDQKVAYYNRITKIVDLLRLTLGCTVADAILLCEKYDIENFDGEDERAIEVFERVSKDRTCFDFVDMLYVPVVENMRFPLYDFVLVDEVQDCSQLQHKLIQKLINPNRGRAIYIGDPNQSIYSFLGADPESFASVLARPNTVKLPLTVSYRCAKSIVRHAQQIVPEIQYHDDKPEGEVVHEGSVKNIKEGDMVLCRINSSLVCLCLDFINQGRKAYIRGSDIGKSLVAFIKPYEGKELSHMCSKLQQKYHKLLDRMKKKYPDRDIQSVKQVQTFQERKRAIEAIADTVETVQEVVDKINKLFSDDAQAGIILSTIHKAKGLEANNVFIIEPKLIPFPFYLTSEWQITEENNLDYVARTRAITKLEYVRDWTALKK